MNKSGVIKVKIHPRFVPVLQDECFCKSSNLILVLHMSPSSEPLSWKSFFHCRECFLWTSIFSSLPSTSMLHHMNMYDCWSKISSTYHLFWVSSKCCSSLLPLFSFLSRRRLTLSEHMTMNECGVSSIFPISSECQFSPWSTEPVEQNSTHRQLGWLVPKRVQLYLPLLRLLEGGSENGVWDVITRRTKLWHGNDRSSHHCPKNWTRWELDPESLWSGNTSIENPLNRVVVDHSLDYIARLPWQLNLRRQL